MYFEITLTLSIISVGLSATNFVLNYKNYAESKARLERNISLSHLFILMSLIFFTISILFPIPFYYQVIPLVQCALLLYFIKAAYELILMSGDKSLQKQNFFVAGMTFIILGSLTLINYFFFHVVSIEGRLYFGMHGFIFLSATAFMVLPLSLLSRLVVIKILKFIPKQHKKLYILYFSQIILYLLSSATLIFILEVRFIIFPVFITISIISLILFMKFPKLLIRINTMFSLKSLLIVKNNGMTLFHKDFSAFSLYEKIDRHRISLLIGGFVFAISKGIKEIIKKEYETILKTIDFGVINMMFGYGERVFGVIFTHEVNNYLQERLTDFIHEFEKKNEKELNDWMGATTYMSKKPVLGSTDDKLVKEIESLLKKYFLT